MTNIFTDFFLYYMKLIDRLQLYIEYKGISLNAFDKSIDASNGYIGKQIKNSGSVGGDVLEKIFCIYNDLNPEWLCTGNGEMIRNGKAQINESGRPPNSELLAEKDKRIEDLYKVIEIQARLIDKLESSENKKSSSQDEQKRKAG